MRGGEGGAVDHLELVSEVVSCYQLGLLGLSAYQHVIEPSDLG